MQGKATQQCFDAREVRHRAAGVRSNSTRQQGGCHSTRGVNRNPSTVTLHSPALELLQCRVQCAPLEVDLGRGPDAQHVFLTGGSCLSVEQVLRAHVG
jgi:hypothetical protein